MQIIMGKVEAVWELRDEGNEPYGMHQVELMQYTGLKDKNGKEIFEGDIVKNTTIKPQNLECYVRQDAIGTVGDSFHFRKLPNEKDITWMWDLSKIEVIGNIYENPELLASRNQT